MLDCTGKFYDLNREVFTVISPFNDIGKVGDCIEYYDSK